MKIKIIILIIVLLTSSSLLLSAKRAPQRCTAIQVPLSTHLPVTVMGVSTNQELEAMELKPVLSLVELPEGFHAVGGGAGSVIACTE